MRCAWALSLASLLAASLLAQDALPQDEQNLYDYALDRRAKGLPLEAVRAFEALARKFPASPLAQSAMEQAAGLYQLELSRPDRARQGYLQLCEKFPQAPGYWTWRLSIAQTYNPEREKKQALEEFRRVAVGAADGDTRANAAHAYWQMQGKGLDLTVERTCTPGEEPVVKVRRQEIKELRYRAFRIEYAAFLPFVDGGDGRGFAGMLDKVAAKDRKMLKEWRESYPSSSEPQNEVKVPATESGVYLLEAEHEGITMQAVVAVGRYGLIAKSAAGTLLCFVQERSTSKPVPGAEIRVLSDERPFRGVTDSQGLFVTAGFKGGFITGIKDGEIFLTDSYYEETAIRTRNYITTDRPLYRPGHTVRFRLVHREERGRALAVKPGQRFAVKITDPRNTPVHEETVTLSDFGTAEGAFPLGDSPTLGEYRISATPEPRGPGRPGEYSIEDWWTESRPSFRVDEYRKPEFKVQVQYGKPLVVQGEKIEASIQAEYYFGGPVGGADVHYEVFQARLSWWSWGWPYYYGWYGENESDSGERFYLDPQDPGESVRKGEGRTDPEGKLAVLIENPRGEEDVVYTVVASVTDLSRRRVEGQGSCKAPRAEISLAMTLNKYVYRVGDRMSIKVRAGTDDDRPVAGTPVVLRAADRRWDKDGNPDERFLFEASSLTDAAGVAEFAFTPDLAGGYVVLAAVAQDRNGNRTRTEEWAWLSGPGEWYTPRNLTGLGVSLDKKVYEAGDTAQVLIQSQEKDITLLLTLEGTEIYHREVVRVKGHARLVELKLDPPDLAPNVYVEVTAIRGNEVLEASKRLVVNPTRKFVTVEITPDRQEYRPRQKARYEIRTTGADGLPVAAEVALGIVDDSIYALQEEYQKDIRKFFIRSRENEVSTSASLYSYQLAGAGAPRISTLAASYGNSFMLEESKESGGGGSGKRYAPTEVRSAFADTMLWKVVRTDPAGRASVEVDIADNLTTWRATARAVTADSRFGQERRSVVSRKNVIVRLETPRFLTQNDASTLTAVIHNDLPAEKELRIEFSASGIEAEGEAAATIRIPAGGRRRLDWKARARDVGVARVRVQALGDTDSDAMEVTLPVLAHGSPRWEARGGVIGPRTVEKVTVPADAIPGTAELVVAVSPVQASMVLDALDSLAGYPYGCVEQTMSRFMPSVVVAGTLKKLGLSRPALEAELPGMISSGLQRLYSMQHEDGGWGWWHNDKTSPWMTAYVLWGLGMAKEAGVKVSPESFGRAVEAASGLLGSSEDLNLEAYLLHALAFAEEPDSDEVQCWRESVTERAGELKPCAQALLALALHRRHLDARPVLQSLAGGIREAGASAGFEQGGQHGWLDDGVEAAAAALRAFLAADPKHPVVPKLVHGLGVARRGPWWTSTRQTAMAVYALSDFVAATGDFDPDMTVSLAFNGKALFSERITRENWPKFSGVRRFSAPELKPGENEIVIEKTGAGSPVYAIAFLYHQRGENLQPSKGGLRIDRSYYAIERKGDDRVLARLPEGFAAKSGQEIEVRLTLTSDGDYEWLMVEDPLPAGFEPVREYWGWWGWEWSYWYDLKEFHDQRVSTAMRHVGAGEHQISYTIRAETPGDYHILPARAFNMYSPEVGGRSAENRIKVVDKK